MEKGGGGERERQKRETDRGRQTDGQTEKMK
jgi:hypothetical protein